jgi:hypothetical protein
VVSVPNLPAHIDLAWQAADRLGHRALDENMGSFLLGAVAPDVRAITKHDRAEYHYAPLNFAELGEGVRGLFAAHPGLRSKPKSDDTAAAFVAGYVTHILLDESWITDVFRPHFGASRAPDDDAESKVMDRALQLEMDRLAEETVGRAMPALGATAMPRNVELIPAVTLEEYKAFVLELLGQGFNWERLRFMARRIAAGSDDHPANRVADEFLDAMPQSLERIFDRVSRGELARFRERAVDRLAGAIEEYLS